MKPSISIKIQAVSLLLIHCLAISVLAAKPKSPRSRPAKRVAAKITFDPPDPTVGAGKSIRIKAIVTDKRGVEIPTAKVAWEVPVGAEEFIEAAMPLNSSATTEIVITGKLKNATSTATVPDDIEIAARTPAGSGKVEARLILHYKAPAAAPTSGKISLFYPSPDTPLTTDIVLSPGNKTKVTATATEGSTPLDGKKIKWEIDEKYKPFIDLGTTEVNDKQSTVTVGAFYGDGKSTPPSSVPLIAKAGSASAVVLINYKLAALTRNNIEFVPPQSGQNSSVAPGVDVQLEVKALDDKSQPVPDAKVEWEALGSGKDFVQVTPDLADSRKATVTGRWGPANVAKPYNISIAARWGTTTKIIEIPYSALGGPNSGMTGEAQAFVSLVDPENVADIFGKRIAGRYIALQITVENASDQRDYLVHDISLDLEKVFPPDEPSDQNDSNKSVGNGERTKRDKRRGVPLGGFGVAGNGLKTAAAGNGAIPRYKFRLSSMELSLLRGVAEKGQGQDKRNLVLRLLRGVGTVAAGFMGVRPLGPSYAPTVAMFNGPLLTSYLDSFPDYTINQLNRLNDSAYRANTLVSKNQSKVVVIFVPQRTFLTNEQRKIFNKNVLNLAYPENGAIDFRRAEVIVHGSFIEEVNDQPPSITTARFDSDSVANFQNEKPVVRGRIVGKYLTDSDIKFADDTTDLSVVKDGNATDNELKFLIKSDKPVKSGREVALEVSNAKGKEVYSLRVSYTAAAPTITTVSLEGVQDTEAEYVLTGKFFPDDLKPSDIIFDPSADIRATEIKPGGTSLTQTIKVKIEPAAEAVDRKMRVRTSEPLKFTIKTKEPTTP